MQITGYIIKILESEGVNGLDYVIVAKIVSCRCLFEPETDHVVAREIFRKDISVPSYCFTYDGDQCDNCGGALDM